MMRFLNIVNHGMEEVAKKEAQELSTQDIKVYDSVIEFGISDIKAYLDKVQSAKRILLELGHFKDIAAVDFKEIKDEELKQYFPDNSKLKVEVENVRGQENRQKIAKEVTQKFFNRLDKVGRKIELVTKNPDIVLIIFRNGKSKDDPGDYFIGLDLAGQINKRSYRLFAHQASFKGDLGYYLVRKSRLAKGEKVLFGFCKDGVLPIEAVKFSGDKVWAFDETRPNVTASRKNSKLAGFAEKIDIQHYKIDELDTRYDQNEFDLLIIQLTQKDEEKINEIYHQADYVLKKKGRLMIIGNRKWEFSLSSKFKILEKGEVSKGDNTYNYWLAERKNSSRNDKDFSAFGKE